VVGLSVARDVSSSVKEINEGANDDFFVECSIVGVVKGSFVHTLVKLYVGYRIGV